MFNIKWNYEALKEYESGTAEHFFEVEGNVNPLNNIEKNLVNSLKDQLEVLEKKRKSSEKLEQQLISSIKMKLAKYSELCNNDFSLSDNKILNIELLEEKIDEIKNSLSKVSEQKINTFNENFKKIEIYKELNESIEKLEKQRDIFINEYINQTKKDIDKFNEKEDERLRLARLNNEDTRRKTHDLENVSSNQLNNQANNLFEKKYKNIIDENNDKLKKFDIKKLSDFNENEIRKENDKLYKEIENELKTEQVDKDFSNLLASLEGKRFLNLEEYSDKKNELEDKLKKFLNEDKFRDRITDMLNEIKNTISAQSQNIMLGDADVNTYNPIVTFNGIEDYNSKDKVNYNYSMSLSNPDIEGDSQTNSESYSDTFDNIYQIICRSTYAKTLSIREQSIKNDRKRKNLAFKNKINAYKKSNHHKAMKRLNRKIKLAKKINSIKTSNPNLKASIQQSKQRITKLKKVLKEIQNIQNSLMRKPKVNVKKSNLNKNVGKRSKK